MRTALHDLILTNSDGQGPAPSAIPAQTDCDAPTTPEPRIGRRRRKREEITQQYLDLFDRAMNLTTNPRRFGIGVPRTNGKQIPIHRNTRHHPCPAIRLNETTDKWRQEPESRRRYHKLHLAGVQSLFEVSHDSRRIARYTADWDAPSGSAAKIEDMAAAAREQLWVLFGIDQPWIEMGRSWPLKPSMYARFLVDWERARLGPARRLAELWVGRVMKSRTPTYDGFVFDALKGLTAYAVPSPRFDRELAELRDVPRTHANVAPALGEDDEIWLPKHKARRLFAAAGVEDIDQAMLDAPEGYQMISRLEAYELDRMLYMRQRDGTFDRAARFHYNPKLEEQHDHFGTLVTAPGWSDPDLLQGFVDWQDSRVGMISWRQFISVLPDDQQDLIHQLRAACIVKDYDEVRRLEQVARRITRTAAPTGSKQSQRLREVPHAADTADLDDLDGLPTGLPYRAGALTGRCCRPLTPLTRSRPPVASQCGSAAVM